MDVRRRDVLKLLVSSAAGSALATRPAKAAEGGAIHRDVCVIGGGSAGTYSAVRLRDLGHSVVVLERSNRLGGHAETFVDPAKVTDADFKLATHRVFHAPDKASSLKLMVLRGGLGR